MLLMDVLVSGSQGNVCDEPSDIQEASQGVLSVNYQTCQL